MVNPFTYGNPISNPIGFFGREREVEQVYSRLCNASFESSSLVGERRIGKTSLLKYLSHPDVRTGHGLDPEKYIFVDVDLQIIDKNMAPSQLWQRLLLRKMAQLCQTSDVKQMIEDMREHETIDNLALAELFDQVRAKGQHVVFLLDEFENVTKNANFGPDFFYGLRSLAVGHNLALITSSRQDLIELCHSEAIRSSPFFNIFSTINLGLFDEIEARQFIIRSLDGTGIKFHEAEISAIFQMAGRHPFFLQAACHFLFDAYTRNLLPADRQKSAEKYYRDEVASHLRDFWHNADGHEKIVLAVLALLERGGKAGKRTYNVKQLQGYYSSAGQTLARLEKRSFVVSKSDGYVLLNSAWSEWIAAEITNPLDAEQSYEDWLKSNRGLMKDLSGRSKSELGEILPKISAKYRELIIGWASDPKNLVVAAGLLRTALGLK